MSDFVEKTKKQKDRANKVKKRIESFSRIKQNWDGYDGKPITKKAIKRATKLLDEIDPYVLEKTEVFPTPKGGVQFETFCKIEIIIEILPNGNLYIYFNDFEDVILS